MSLILPKYPFLTLDRVDTYSITDIRVFDVRFITKKTLEAQLQMEIDTEIKNLFKMIGAGEKNVRFSIHSWFKTPRQKEWSFTSTPGYDRS